MADDFDRTVEQGWNRTPSAVDWLARGQAQFGIRDGSATSPSPCPKNGARGILTDALGQDVDIALDKTPASR